MAQMDAIVHSYEKWSYQMKGEDDPEKVSASFIEEPEGMGNIILFDTHSMFPLLFYCSVYWFTLGTYDAQYSMVQSDEYISAALVRQGMIPGAPFRPKYAFSTRLLELYRNLQCRCPHLARQSFIKGIMDMQAVSHSSCCISQC